MLYVKIVNSLTKMEFVKTNRQTVLSIVKEFAFIVSSLSTLILTINVNLKNKVVSTKTEFVNAVTHLLNSFKEDV